ncbi:MAG TPA: hypothetical protein VMM76_19050, partial [Pirellulaceae bacterium]|nr:hypothetical protein [Pirellulaceae bacterium]
MSRLARAEVFAPDEVAIVHVISRVVRRCFLFGDDPVTGKNFDHRKVWIEDRLQQFAAAFGIDLLAFSCLSNHFHLILRSRPDVVATWDDTEVARRWLLLCPVRKSKDGRPKEPNEFELNSICHDPERLAKIRTRLSDISWWMRLLCQNIAQRANREDGEVGKFFQARFRAVRILDDESLLACAAYVDLNPIRAALAETLEQCDFTSVQRRIQSLPQSSDGSLPRIGAVSRDCFLAPLAIDERRDPLGACPHLAGHRCSDKGFLAIGLGGYLQLLDWTARQMAPGKRGATPTDAPPIFERLSMSGETWCELVRNFGRLFYNVAGHPQQIEAARSRTTN